MKIRSALARIAAPAILAVSMAAGLAGNADAAPYKQTCAGGVCFNKDTQGYTNDRTYFYVTFNGTAVTHYNVRYREPGGRTVQGELKTYAGSNKSQEGSIKGVPGQMNTIAIQACYRVTVKIGPFSAGTQSRCTGWSNITYKQV